MDPIFDRDGSTVGWLDVGVIFDAEGQHRAFLDKGAVYTFEAVYIGTLQNGFFRDKEGDAVALMQGASGGPIPPITEMPPIPPMKSDPPIPPIPDMIPPIPPLGSLDWSSLSWDQYLAA